MTLEISKQAPTFALQNQHDETVTLEEHKGKWVVLYFYPKAMTPGCTTQAQCMRDNIADIQKHNAVVFGISPDEPKRLAKFIEKENLNFDLLGDPDHTMAEQYDVWVEKNMYGRKYMGMERSTVIIDPEGKVAEIMRKVKPKEHHTKVVKFLENQNNS